MTADQFVSWLRTASLTPAQAARELGVHPNTITRYKAEGAPRTVALACRAVFHRLEPWS